MSKTLIQGNITENRIAKGIITDGYKIISYEATYSPLTISTTSKETLTISATVSDFGNAEVKKVTPLTTSGNEELSSATNKLKDYNYHVDVEEYDIDDQKVETKNEYQVSADLNNEQVFVDFTNIYGLNSSFAYYEKNDAIYQAYKIAGNYYQFLGATNYSADSLLPKFNISSQVFDKSGSTYTLKKTVPAITPSCSTYDMFLTESIDELTITVNADSLVFTNKTSSNKTITTYSNINSVTKSINVSDVKTDCSSLTWKQLIENQPETYKKLVTFCKSEDVVNLIPTVGLTSSYASIGIDDTYREIIVPLGRDKTIAKSQLSTFVSNLTSKGWGELETQLTGAYRSTYSAAVKVSDNLSVTPYLDLFTVTDSNGMFYLYIYVYINL